MLTVADTGLGMTPDVQERIFEPFFTTKGPGRGTGLGLATVHGVIQQSHGSIGVTSRVGGGTEFRIFLPAVAGKSASAEPAREPAPGGTETILLVEDEDGVRALARMALEARGYSVLEASNGDESLRIAAGSAVPIHLLLTDVVMPGTGGRLVAERLRELHPAIRVLFMSGHADDAIVRHGVLTGRVDFLQKPFTPCDLAWRVREVLDGLPGSSRA